MTAAIEYTLTLSISWLLLIIMNLLNDEFVKLICTWFPLLRFMAICTYFQIIELSYNLLVEWREEFYFGSIFQY